MSDMSDNNIMDLSDAVEAKSDQLNAADLLGGPLTITITGFTHRAGGEQPTSIFYEGDNGKPYKPCLGFRRIILDVWGKCNPVGRKLTLFREPSVKYSGKETGGIEICAMSEITHELTLPVRLNGKAVKMVKIKPIETAKKTKLSQAEFDKLSEAIKAAETMPELSKVAKSIKAGNYEGDDLKAALLAEYTSKKDSIANN